MSKTYHSSGFVLGYVWGGGKGSYGVKRFESPNKRTLLKMCREALDNNSLDNGMGFESLIGALIQIKTVTKVNLKGKLFINEEFDTEFIGKLTDNDKDSLVRAYMQ